MQQPSVGRAVHYVSHGTPVREDGTQTYVSACRAATITEVSEENPGLIGISVTNPTGMFFHPLESGGCRYDETGTDATSGGTWHWPERV